MNIIAWDKEADIKITPERAPNDGEWAAWLDAKGEVRYKKEYEVTDPSELKSESERAWRDSEILRTDKLVILPDYPDDLLTYREALRDYPQQPAFPNGDRPTI